MFYLLAIKAAHLALSSIIPLTGAVGVGVGSAQSAVRIDTAVYYCDDIGPLHPAWDPCHGVWDN